MGERRVLNTRDEDPHAQFLRVILRAGGLDWHFGWEEGRRNPQEWTWCQWTGGETVRDGRTVGQKGSSRLELKWAVSLSFCACLEN